MKGLIRVSSVSLMVLAVCATASAAWEAYKIRPYMQESTGGTIPILPEIKDVTYHGVTAKEFGIALPGQKAAWGTSDLDGHKLSEIATLSISRLDDTTRFAAGSGPACAPYLNIWITGPEGQFAVIANEPTNAEWAGAQKWNMTWDILRTKSVKVYESSYLSWLPDNGVGLTFGDLANFTILAPTPGQQTWAGLTSGAPREYLTNHAYGINWVFGDTLANYLSGDDGYIVANPTATAVPEPFTVGLGIAGLLAAFGVRRRRRA